MQKLGKFYGLKKIHVSENQIRKKDGIGKMLNKKGLLGIKKGKKTTFIYAEVYTAFNFSFKRSRSILLFQS